MVPVGASALAGAVRVAAVNGGRFSLRRQEARLWARQGPGGHTIRLHIGQSEEALRRRIAETAGRPGRRPHVISSFDDIATAEAEISRLLQIHKTAIETWSRSARQGITRNIDMNMGRTIGYGVVRETGAYRPMSGLRVVIKRESYRGTPHYVLTAHPIL